jgi:PRTRC genetic system protein A
MARQNTAFLTDVHWPDTVEKPVNYIVRRDGLWELRNSRAGQFLIQKEKFAAPLPGFPEESNVERGIPHFGKIPIELYYQIQAFFKSICDESRDEAYVQTFWDSETSAYFNYVPRQRVSGASVHFDRDVDLEKRCALVLETHSHNTMNAFFSGTDNADEKSDRFFGVLGKLNQSTPETLFSFVCGGKRVIINRFDIFEEPEVSFPGDWKSRITKHEYTAAKSYTSGYGMETQRSSMSDMFTERAHQLDLETELELGIQEARTGLGGAVGEADFLPLGDLPSVEKKSDTPLGTLVKEVTAKLENEGLTMSRIQKQRLFYKLVEAMSEEDVQGLLEALHDGGYERAIAESLPDDLDVASDESSDEKDPFIGD